MASTHRRHTPGTQSGFALILALAAFAASVFLWADARADTGAQIATVRTDAPA